MRSMSLVVDLIDLVTKHKSGELRCPATALIICTDTVDGPMYENTSRTTATVKLKGSLDVLVTPLLLESLQRYL